MELKNICIVKNDILPSKGRRRRRCEFVLVVGRLGIKFFNDNFCVKSVVHSQGCQAGSIRHRLSLSIAAVTRV